MCSCAPTACRLVYTDSSGRHGSAVQRLHQLTDTASSVTVSFFRNGAAQGNPATVPVDGAGLRALQTMAERVRLAVQSTRGQHRTGSGRNGRSSGDGIHPAVARRNDTPGALYPEARCWSIVATGMAGSVAAGETLCAVRTAATDRPASAAWSPNGACQSPLIAAFASGRHPAAAQGQAEPPASGIDPLVQQALQADADVAEAPCGPAGAPPSCLEPAATQLQTPPGRGHPTPHLASGRTIGQRRLRPTDGGGQRQRRHLLRSVIRITWNPVAGAIADEGYRNGSRIASASTGFDGCQRATPGRYLCLRDPRACNANRWCRHHCTAGTGLRASATTDHSVVTACAVPGGTINRRLLRRPSTLRDRHLHRHAQQRATKSNGHRLRRQPASGTIRTTGPITANCTVTAASRAVTGVLPATAPGPAAPSVRPRKR